MATTATDEERDGDDLLRPSADNFVGVKKARRNSMTKDYTESPRRFQTVKPKRQKADPHDLPTQLLPNINSTHQQQA